MFFVFLLFCLSLASPVISWSAPAPHYRSLNFLGGGGSSSSLGVGSASAGNGGASATGIGASSGSDGYSNALGLGSASNNYRGSSATGLGYGSSGYGGSNAIGIGSANSAGRSGSSLGIGSAQSSPWGSSATGIGSASSGYGLRDQNPSSSSALGVGFSQDIEGGPSVGLGFGNANSFGGDGGQASGSGFSASIDPGIGGYNNAMGRDQTMFDSGSSRDDYMMQKKRTCPCYSDKSLNGHYLLRGGKKKPHFRKMRSLDYEDYVPRPNIR